MRLLVQRVGRASVDIGGERISEIGAGLLVLVGDGTAATPEDAD